MERDSSPESIVHRLAGQKADNGIEEPVNSPTFTIVQVYEEGRLPFYHFDVYRIGDVEEMDEVGLMNMCRVRASH